MEDWNDNQYKLHILIAYDKNDRTRLICFQRSNLILHLCRKNMLGGAACEYYPISSVGLLSYFAVAPAHRGKCAYMNF